MPTSLTVTGLFAGIGGLERGLHSSGLSADLLCEIDPGCRAVLGSRFAGIPTHGDVRTLKSLPESDVVAAGFPCTDLSQAGRTAGIGGSQSGLVAEVFRLLENARRAPTWLLLENVPFMLQLERGQGMRFLIESLEDLGYQWAYRVIDARAFGLPQRRRRVILLASKKEDPRGVLFSDEARPDLATPNCGWACGFYWTEGVRGLGWAVNAIPTLKGGSTVGIPSPPAILFPNGDIRTPDVRDAERLQGFPVDWTDPVLAVRGRREGARWKLIGNAVSVPVAKWVGQRLLAPGEYAGEEDIVQDSEPWPTAAWGAEGKVFRVRISEFPKQYKMRNLHEFLRYEGKLLSLRATSGFLKRTDRSRLNFPPGFLDQVYAHKKRMEINSSST